MQREIIACCLLFTGVLAISIFAASGSSEDNNKMKDLKEKVGEKNWQIIKKRISKEYRRSVMEWVEHTIKKIGENFNDLDKSVKSYFRDEISYLESNYFVVNEQLITVPDLPTISPSEGQNFPDPYESGLSQKKEQELIRKALDAARDSAVFTDGTKAFVRRKGNEYRVIFEARVKKELVPAAGYLIKVIIDSESEKVKKVVGGA